MRPKAQPGLFLEGGATTKSKFLHKKLSNLGPVLNKLMQLKRISKRPGGRVPSRWANFVILRQQTAILTPFHSLFARL